MVVIHHEELNQFLWGPSSHEGRSKQLDAIVLKQIVGFGIMVILCGLVEYDKPAVSRAAFCIANLTFYFKSVQMFIRMFVVTCFLILVGDIISPATRILAIFNVNKSMDQLIFPGIKLVLHILLFLNSMCILYKLLTYKKTKTQSSRKTFHSKSANSKRKIESKKSR